MNCVAYNWAPFARFRTPLCGCDCDAMRDVEVGFFSAKLFNDLMQKHIVISFIFHSIWFLKIFSYQFCYVELLYFNFRCSMLLYQYIDYVYGARQMSYGWLQSILPSEYPWLRELVQSFLETLRFRQFVCVSHASLSGIHSEYWRVLWCIERNMITSRGKLLTGRKFFLNFPYISLPISFFVFCDNLFFLFMLLSTAQQRNEIAHNNQSINENNFRFWSCENHYYLTSNERYQFRLLFVEIVVTIMIRKKWV